MGASRIVIDTYSIDFLPAGHPVRGESDTIEAPVRPYVPLELTIRAQHKGQWTDADFLERVAAVQTALESDPEIGRTLSVNDIFHDMHMSLTGESLNRPWAPDNDEEAPQFLRYIRMAGKEHELARLVARDDRTLRLTATTPMASDGTSTARNTKGSNPTATDNGIHSSHQEKPTHAPARR